MRKGYKERNDAKNEWNEEEKKKSGRMQRRWIECKKKGKKEEVE